MKIPIKHAIDSGAWFHCSSIDVEAQLIEFRLKVLSFIKISIDEIDDPAKIDANIFDLEEGDFWLFKFQIINLTKSNIEPANFISLNIIDQDDFQYSLVIDNHLYAHSKLAQTSGLSKIVSRAPLIPKIKYAYSCAYFLPREDNAEYYLSVGAGDIIEV